MKEKENNTLVRPLQYNFMTSFFIYIRDHFIGHTFQFPVGLSLFTFLDNSTLFLGNFVHLYNGFCSSPSTITGVQLSCHSRPRSLPSFCLNSSPCRYQASLQMSKLYKKPVHLHSDVIPVLQTILLLWICCARQ